MNTKQGIQIEQTGTGFPGMGGLNYDELSSLGWRPGMWLPVVFSDSAGVFVKLPKATGNTWIRRCEITATREPGEIDTSGQAAFEESLCVKRCPCCDAPEDGEAETCGQCGAEELELRPYESRPEADEVERDTFILNRDRKPTLPTNEP